MTTPHNTETHSQIPPKTQKASTYHKLTPTLLALAIIANAAYTVYTNHQLTHHIQTLTTGMLALKQQQIDTATVLESHLKDSRLTQTTLTQQWNAVSKQLSQALQERWYQSHDWLLLKARYCLELAQINAHWGRDSQTTVALFQQADDLLANAHDPEIYPVREAIAKEISALQATPPLDVAGLMTKLDAAQQQLTHLSIKHPFSSSISSSNATVAATPAPSTTSSIWREHLFHSIERLKTLVLIRHHDEPIEPLLSPEYELLLRESCMLNLQEAQWAVIQQNNDVYQLALTQAARTINRTFDLNAPETQALIQQLHVLQETSLNMQTQHSTDALLLLNHLLEAKDLKLPLTGEQP